jgi:hypothetical protein
MPPHLIIDGYNYLHRISPAAMQAADIEGARHFFLEQLADYKKGKRMGITVVFDGIRSGSLSRFREAYKGIEVIYSRQGESADDVIIQAIRARRSGLVVVTSDRAIIEEAKKHAVAFITPPQLERACMGDSEDEAEGGRAEKKGNARRLPKNVRKARKTINKI